MPEHFGDGIIAGLVLWNLMAFAMMGVDKRRAKRGEWRVRERTLLLSAFLLGGPGILAGMLVFRHKTKHRSFQILVPLGILFDFVVILWILNGIYDIIIAWIFDGAAFLTKGHLW